MYKTHNFDVALCSPELIKDTGSHYTPSELADFIADQILLNSYFKKNQPLKILDPAIGNGELIISLLRKLEKTHQGKIEVCGYDTNQKAISYTQEILRNEFPQISLSLYCKDFLTSASEIKNTVDIVISNPPYIRTQIMGSANAQKLAQEYGLDGRVDLYYAFFPAIRTTLKDNGVLGIITSNRFMSTKSGESVRESILQSYRVHEIWDFGDTKLFEAAVLPCVLILSPGTSTAKDDICFSSSYSCFSETTPSNKVNNVADLFENQGLIFFKNESFVINSGLLKIGENKRDVWTISNKTSRDFLENVAKNTALTFKEIGKIRVGVKTTADSVFIKKKDEWDLIGIEENVLKNLTTHHIARRWYPNSNIRNKKILYTHCLDQNQKIMTICYNQYPIAKKYLEDNKAKLSSRKYVIDAGRKWYEIWVPQNPAAWPKEKIVFRDIAEKPTFWFDDEGTIINGDCYWFTNDKGHDDNILWLALAIANSDFILKFYEYKFNNKLYSGRCRFMSQYVGDFPVPSLSLKASKDIISLAKKAYALSKIDSNTEEIENQINLLVWKVFQVSK